MTTRKLYKYKQHLLESIIGSKELLNHGPWEEENLEKWARHLGQFLPKHLLISTSDIPWGKGKLEFRFYQERFLYKAFILWVGTIKDHSLQVGKSQVNRPPEELKYSLKSFKFLEMD